MLQQGGSEPYKMELASDTLWTLSGITLITYMHIWLVEFKAILHKAIFFLTLWKTFLLINLCSPFKVLLEKLACWDPPLTSLISCSELSVTGDTAKYLVWHSREVVHVHHKTQSAQTILYTPAVIRKRRRLRRDLWETVPCSSGQTHTRHSSAANCRNQVPRTYLVKAEP